MAKTKNSKSKSDGKNPGITNTDVKEATNATDVSSIDFPDAPVVAESNVQEAAPSIPAVEANVPAVEANSANAFPPDSPEPVEAFIPESTADTVAPSEIIAPVASKPPVQAKAPVAVAPPVPNTPKAPPTQEELDEKVIETWWNNRNKPSEVNHFELCNSSEGVNMNRFSALETTVGKFKFKRAHGGDSWKITIQQ